jgi:membrane fusion protein (multidrug efflux system)
MSDKDKENEARDARVEFRKGGDAADAGRSRGSLSPGSAGARLGPGATGKARKGPKVVGTIVLVVLLLVGFFFGGVWLVDSIAWASTDDAAIDGNHVNVAAKILGRIKSIEVAEGDKVKTGQVVVLLDDTDLRAQQLAASASLASAQQNLALSKINLDKTQDDFNRAEVLYKTQATTKENYDHAAKALDSANAQYALAKAQVDGAQAQLGVLAVSLLNTRIDAPMDGTVQKEVYMKGDVVQPGQTIITINDLDDIWVTANFEETKVARIKPGAPVLVTVDALGGRALEGTVTTMGAGIVAPPFSIGDFTKTTQRVPVKIHFTSRIAGLPLLPGMSVEVKVRTPAKIPAFLESVHF